MKKKFFAFVCSAMISVNCLTFNTVEAKVLEPEVIKTETWEASYFIDDDYETLYPYLKCIFNVYSNGSINFRVYNTHEFDGFSNIYNDIVFPYTRYSDSYNKYYKLVEGEESTAEFVEYSPKYGMDHLIFGYSDRCEFIPLSDTDIRECVPVGGDYYNTNLSVGDTFKWSCNTGSTSTNFPDKFVCDAECVYYNQSLTHLDNDDMFFSMLYRYNNNYNSETGCRRLDNNATIGFSLMVSYTDNRDNSDDYRYTRTYDLYTLRDVSLAELGSYRGYEYDDGLMFEYKIRNNPSKFPTEDETYTLFGHTVTVPASIYTNVVDTVDKNLTADQQYIHDLERQLNETRSELEKYQALDYNSDNEITALDAQMLLSYYANSLVGNNSNDVSGYKDFIANNET